MWFSFSFSSFSFLPKDVGENWQNRSFDWSEYLKKTGAKAAANHQFEHVRMNFFLCPRLKKKQIPLRFREFSGSSPDIFLA